ncbi:MAG: two-component system, chemotaxis family, protein-glutamate methylesterase/glutaminase [Acidobacteriota bacterium]|jgi:two-component system chemotaxis response regulator CheB|nr:two-component system, chemotaxis family, protein-glutamate methylesterase/glutaminase [Acidobacteriota bacterium]
MASRDIILIGASAGGVQALSEVIGGLPADFPAAIFVVLHISPYGRSAMPVILSRAGHLPAVHATDSEPVRMGHVYVAPPDHHMVLQDGLVRLSRAPTENAQRPSIDVLFRTGAQAYGRRAIGVVLTGNLDDGTNGLAVVKRHGGTSVVQDPEEADYPSMPLSAIANVDVDYVLPLAGIVPLLVELIREPLEEPEPEPEDLNMKEELEHGQDHEELGAPSDLTCPDCGGSLRESRVEEVVHFRCRTGHAYSPETLLAKQDDVVEAALWAAVRSLLENAALARRMERRMGQGSRLHHGAEQRYERRAEEAERHAEILRRLLVQDKAKAS